MARLGRADALAPAQHSPTRSAPLAPEIRYRGRNQQDSRIALRKLQLLPSPIYEATVR